jgi:hypothetical protein
MTKKEAIENGTPYACLKCHTVYAAIPTEVYEDGHGVRIVEKCLCGCKLFMDLRTDKQV